ncbi:MAG: lysophospholipid acyltransferase family protein [Bacteroidales bacterium]
MTTILYFVFEVVSRMLCILPKRAIYIVADFLYIIAYYVVQYRKKVVFENLRNSFPEKTEKDIKIIAKKFYRHLGDIIVENIAILNMKPKKVMKFITVKNIELVNKLHDKGKNSIALTGHYGNWEFLTTLSEYTPYTILSVYKPLRNKFFDRKVYEMRKRFSAIPVPMKEVYKAIIRQQKQNKPYIMGLVADQCPPKKNINYWTTFLNQETPFFTGAEKITRKFNNAAVFTIVKKKKRGWYEIEFNLMSEDTKKFKETGVTEKYARLLEEQIISQPEYWLWSHRRWKHTPKKN